MTHRWINGFKRKIYIIISGIGIGMVLVIIIPFWIWILLVGAGLIYWGWYLIFHCH